MSVARIHIVEEEEDAPKPAVSLSRVSKTCPLNSKETPSAIPKGGKIWKTHSTKAMKQRLVRNKASKISVDEQMSRKRKLNELKDMDREMKEEAKEERKEKWRRLQQKKKAKEENEAKSTVVQRVTNLQTLKKMSRKQLRQLVRA